jgi:predicted AlkP superfamily phosphohydrolase/phosphomutase
MSENGRLVIIGIDGAPYGLMEDLSDKEVMPYFKQLRKEGAFVKMRSSVPEISSVSWSSIITGKNPGEHGVYGFTHMMDGTYTLSFPSFKDLKVPPFWQRDRNKKYVVINVPFTYPAQEMNGVLISGFVALDLENAVYPPLHLQKLRDLNYRIDIDAEKGHKSKLLLFKELFTTLEARIKAYKYFWDAVDWDVFILVFTGSDRLEHFLWNAYEDETHEHRSQFLEFFERIDGVIGEINNRLDEDDSLVILSDHGMEGIRTDVNVNAYLVQEGFLLLEDDPNKKYNCIKEGTKAFALDPGRVYLNKKGKYPRGCIRDDEEKGVIEELIDSFAKLRWNGERVINRIYRKEEIYHGNFVEQAPDLVLMSNSGFNLKAGLFKKELFEEDPLTGKHTQADAFLLIKNGGEVIPKNPSVEDVVPILSRFGVET